MSPQSKRSRMKATTGVSSASTDYNTRFWPRVISTVVSLRSFTIRRHSWQSAVFKSYASAFRVRSTQTACSQPAAVAVRSLLSVLVRTFTRKAAWFGVWTALTRRRRPRNNQRAQRNVSCKMLLSRDALTFAARQRGVRAAAVASPQRIRMTQRRSAQSSAPSRTRADR